MDKQHRVSIDGGAIAIAAVVHLPATTPAPVVVCCHGLLSLKESPKFVALGEALAGAGFCVLRFDFCGCGESPRRPGTDLIEGRRRDLSSVLAYAVSQPWAGRPLGLIGSSMGGFLALLAADADPGRVHAVATWAAPFDISGIHPGAEGMSGLAGLFPEGFRLGEPQILDHLGNVKRALVIHGQEDEVVPWSHAVRIYDRVGDPKNLMLLRTADHQITNEDWRKAAVRASVEWFVRHMK
ncbi:MAG: alpha/beta fold hydrolase [Desulfobacteraceae bacterium]|nr:alpha/beta fold hydrolase [Desulfobacteraceae bacterium]